MNNSAERSILQTTYVIISGAGTARRMPAVIARLANTSSNLITVLTENAHRVLSSRELILIEGNNVVDSYFDDAILPYPPYGVVLLAPCTFNSLNKLAQGIADTLALSIAAEAIGRGTPVIVAVSVNAPLWNHPRARQSVEILRSWGVAVIEPVEKDEYLTMAADEVLIDAVESTWRNHGNSPKNQ